MRTDAPDGLVSWLGLDQAQEDYLGLGLDDGLVKVLYVQGFSSLFSCSTSISIALQAGKPLMSSRTGPPCYIGCWN